LSYFAFLIAAIRKFVKGAAMLPTFQIRKLPGDGDVWEVVLKFKTGHLETWIGFSSETEARSWVDKKLGITASTQK
jgi:hypothetical protein